LDLDVLKNPKDEEKNVSAYHMWEHLKLKYALKDGISALLDYQKFIHSKLTDDGTLEDQLNRHSELRSRCITSGYQVQDWTYASLLLLALPELYLHIRDTFLTTNTVQELKSLGADPYLPSGQIESFFRVIYEITHQLPSG
jgi:hypothetical protein